MLVLKTEISDPNGTDLGAVVDALCDPELHKVKLIEGRFMEKEMNYLYSHLTFSRKQQEDQH